MNKVLPVANLAAKLSTVIRSTGYRAGHLENDAEHSYQLALASWSANKQYNLGLSDEKILKYALVHDLVEVYAGDVDAHAAKVDMTTKKANEAKAFETMKEEYGQFLEIIEAIEGYEGKSSNEACLVYVMDKLLPNANVHFGGSSYYHERKITLEEWKKWLKVRIGYESLNSQLKQLVDEAIHEVETVRASAFYNPVT